MHQSVTSRRAKLYLVVSLGLLTASSQSPSSSSEAEASEVHPQFYFKPVTPTGESLTGPDGTRLQDHGKSKGG